MDSGQEIKKEKTEKRVRIVVEETPPATQSVHELRIQSREWFTVRFFELFFAASSIILLLTLSFMSPIYDDYTDLWGEMRKYPYGLDAASTRVFEPEETSAGTASTCSDAITGNRTYATTTYPPPTANRTETTRSGMKDHESKRAFATYDVVEYPKFHWRLSYAILLFTLTTTMLLILSIDSGGRIFNKPMNRLPMVIFLLLCESFSLIMTVLTIDMYLKANNTTIIVITAANIALAICFAIDFLSTLIRGNGES